MSDLHELVQALSQEVVLWDTYVATAALLVFDHIITFDQEVERIWKRKRNVASVLFVVNRIGALLFSTTMMWNTFGPAIATSCAVSFELWIAFTLIMQFVIPIFFCLRIWAIWGRHWLPLVVLVPLSCAIMGITIYLDAVQFYWQISFDLPAPFGGCEYATYASLVVLSRLTHASTFLSISTTIIVLCATLAKTVKTKREANHAGIKAGLTTLLLRDGSLYAGVIFLFNMIAVILLYVVSEQLGILGSMSQAVSCIVVNRMILNLRGLDVVDSADISAPSRSFRISSVNFAGNIGAPLNHDSLFNDDGDEASIRIVSNQLEDPLAIGVFEKASISRYSPTQEDTNSMSQQHSSVFHSEESVTVPDIVAQANTEV